MAALQTLNTMKDIPNLSIDPDSGGVTKLGRNIGDIIDILNIFGDANGQAPKKSTQEMTMLLAKTDLPDSAIQNCKLKRFFSRHSETTAISCCCSYLHNQPSKKMYFHPPNKEEQIKCPQNPGDEQILFWQEVRKVKPGTLRSQRKY